MLIATHLQMVCQLQGTDQALRMLVRLGNLHVAFNCLVAGCGQMAGFFLSGSQVGRRRLCRDSCFRAYDQTIFERQVEDTRPVNWCCCW